MSLRTDNSNQFRLNIDHKAERPYMWMLSFCGYPEMEFSSFMDYRAALVFGDRFEILNDQQRVDLDAMIR